MKAFVGWKTFYTRLLISFTPPGHITTPGPHVDVNFLLICALPCSLSFTFRVSRHSNNPPVMRDLLEQNFGAAQGAECAPTLWA